MRLPYTKMFHSYKVILALVSSPHQEFAFLAVHVTPQ